MNQSDRPLIVGAGPVGLGAALFLARRGPAPRLVEMRGEPSRQSKALAVNPRTLEILEPTGVTSRMLELGSPIHWLHIHRRERIVAALSLAGIHPTYPFMLALSQATSERLLAEALQKAGGVVERGVKLVECRNVDGGVEAVLEPAAGGPAEVVRCPWMLAADGAHSTARETLGIEFGGSSFGQPWYLADVPLRTSLLADHAHVFLLEGGVFIFMIRVVDGGASEQTSAPVWRVMGNRPDPISRLVQAEQAGPPIWTSGFHISHRIAATLAAGGVYLAGDAAHLHSPVGARGMNLGLEDAWVFAELVRVGRLGDYNGLRRPVDQRVVSQVEFLSRIVSAVSPLDRVVRSFVLPTAIRNPMLRSAMMTTITGLDHALPSFLPTITSDAAGAGARSAATPAEPRA
jgi:2-polyprenyl-6-methoxyphenol hydroxylase-like FAD-dependent oxidoreductase